MPARTRQNPSTVLVGVTPVLLLPNAPRRKAFLLSPLAGNSGVTNAMVAVAFQAGGATSWTVPAGVTSMLDAFVWGSAGNAGASGAVVGGGGGGGGSFATAGPQTLVPGSVWTISVDTAGSGGTSSLTNPGGAAVATAGSGANGALGAGGAGGAASTGLVQEGGGNGATTATGLGGGGGGAAGYIAQGTNGAGRNGGAGGGAATYQGYGDRRHWRRRRADSGEWRPRHGARGRRRRRRRQWRCSRCVGEWTRGDFLLAPGCEQLPIDRSVARRGRGPRR